MALEHLKMLHLRLSTNPVKASNLILLSASRIPKNPRARSGVCAQKYQDKSPTAQEALFLKLMRQM